MQILNWKFVRQTWVIFIANNYIPLNKCMQNYANGKIE